tara:strand:+ start:371 stop:520 length:150 start_codon:yes stop_codon:yes gene_type:complete
VDEDCVDGDDEELTKFGLFGSLSFDGVDLIGSVVFAGFTFVLVLVLVGD